MGEFFMIVLIVHVYLQRRYILVIYIPHPPPPPPSASIFQRNYPTLPQLPSVHVLGNFNFKDIHWSDRLNKSGAALSQSEGKIMIDIMNDHDLEQLVHFPTREKKTKKKKNTLDLILTSLPGQFQDIHSPDKLSDHDIVSWTLKLIIPPIKKPRRKVYLYQKDDFEPLSKDAFDFARE